VIRTDNDAKRSFEAGEPPVAQQRGGEQPTTPADDDDTGVAEVEEWRS
jgi:hypothetical protein